MGLHDNLCQSLRQKIKDEGKNQTSFDCVPQQTISGLVNKRGNISTLCKVLEELGVRDVKFDKNITCTKCQQRNLLIAFAKYMEEDKMYERHDEANVDDFLYKALNKQLDT